MSSSKSPAFKTVCSTLESTAPARRRGAAKAPGSEALQVNGVLFIAVLSHDLILDAAIRVKAVGCDRVNGHFYHDIVMLSLTNSGSSEKWMLAGAALYSHACCCLESVLFMPPCVFRLLMPSAACSTYAQGTGRSMSNASSFLRSLPVQ